MPYVKKYDFSGGMDMWYVIQTQTGREEELLLFMRKILTKGICNNSFVLKVAWPKRYNGQWRLYLKPLFPGYTFVETETPQKLFEELKKIPQFSKLLSCDKYEFVPLKKEEESFLMNLINAGKKEPFVIHPSKILVSEDGKVKVISGVLKQYEQEIIRVNLHKRYAVVKINMLGEKTVLFGILIENNDNFSAFEQESNEKHKREKRK